MTTTGTATHLQRYGLHWVGADHLWVLPTSDGLLALEPEDADAENWSVIFIPRHAPEQRLRAGLSLDYAHGVAETEARRRDAWPLAATDMAWRSDPSTPKQRETLNRSDVVVTPEMTRGEAADAMVVVAARVALKNRNDLLLTQAEPVVTDAEDAPPSDAVIDQAVSDDGDEV